MGPIGEDRGPWRAVLFTSELGSGGAERHLLRLANHLDPARFEVHVATARGGSYMRSLSPHVKLHPLTSDSAGSTTRALLRAARPLRGLVAQVCPHLVYSTMDHANIIASLVTRSLRRRPKLVLSVQNPIAENWGSDVHPTKIAVRAAIRRLYPGADRIVVPSTGVAYSVEDHVPRATGRIVVLPNAGWDDDAMASASTPRPIVPARPLVVACGRLTEQKGFIDLIDAMALVRRTLPARLWILGEGPLRAALQYRIELRGLGGIAELRGFQDDPFPFLAAAELFVSSSHFEGFGIAMVEAMACGTAIVATRCPYGPEDILEHGASGVLVPVADPPALAQAIVAVLQDDGLRGRLRTAARRRAAAFHAHTVADQHAALFEHLVRET